VKILENIDLAARTTLRIGGRARYYAQPATFEEVVTAVVRSRAENLPLLVLGRGSNLLISDQGWPGLALDLTALNTIVWSGPQLICACGASIRQIVNESVAAGLQGMEELAGIPGTIGGALIMNAGAFGQTISDCLEWVEGIDLTNSTPWHRERSAIVFGYRHSSLAGSDSLVCRAQFRLHPGNAAALQNSYENILRVRKEKQPLDLPNCGSVFKRPPGDYAGRLIEACGLKGMRIGDAMVSTRHTNFIVNMGAATAADMRRLILLIQEKVYREQGVLLEPEVIFVGEFEQPLFVPAAVDAE
jgi:UDP-N-acetylmuramate dehydrogenase